MPDPVSWFLIEPGWSAVGARGEELGRVERVLGDTDLDIFDGLLVSRGLLRRRAYAPAEVVTTIVEGQVTLDLTSEQFARLEDSAPRPPG